MTDDIDEVMCRVVTANELLKEVYDMGPDEATKSDLLTALEKLDHVVYRKAVEAWDGCYEP